MANTNPLRAIRLLPVLIAVMLSPVIASADQGWTGFRAIIELEVTSGSTEVLLAGANGACTTINGNTWVSIPVGHSNEKHFLAALHSAFAAGKTINVYCSSAAQWAPIANMKVSP